MAERPEPFVREPVVIPLQLAAIEPHAPQAVQGIGGRHVQPVASIDHERVGGSGTVCHPYSGARFDERLESRDEPARRT